MIGVAKSADAATLAGFDVVIDVRSPGEFAEDHVPGAINLPVLSNAERAEVGEIYVQRDKFDARRLGAAYVARNVGAHLQGPLAAWPGGFRPLIYCWRGGMRSNAMAVILDQVGWRVGVLNGGYRTYRRGVVERLYAPEPAFTAVVLDGPTGVGKTDMLVRLAARGMQALDLEGLANHRGSLFGDLGAQPSQKLFESRLLSALDGLDRARPVVVEAESSRIGEVFLPPALWRAMEAGRRVALDAPAEARAAALLADYAGFAQDREKLAATLQRLPGRHGRKRLAAWAELAHAGGLAELALQLVVEHYDPAYARARKDMARPSAVVDLETLEPARREAAADRLVTVIDAGV